jgi:hypothetical protein
MLRTKLLLLCWLCFFRVDAGYGSAPDEDEECDEEKKVIKAKDDDCDGPPKVFFLDDIEKTMDNKYTKFEVKAVEIANKVLSHTVDAYMIAVFKPKNLTQEEVIFIAASFLLVVLNTYILCATCCEGKKRKGKGKKED